MKTTMKIFSEQTWSISYLIQGSKGIQSMEVPIHHTLIKASIIIPLSLMRWNFKTKIHTQTQVQKTFPFSNNLCSESKEHACNHTSYFSRPTCLFVFPSTSVKMKYYLILNYGSENLVKYSGSYMLSRKVQKLLLWMLWNKKTRQILWSPWTDNKFHRIHIVGLFGTRYWSLVNTYCVPFSNACFVSHTVTQKWEEHSTF